MKALGYVGCLALAVLSGCASMDSIPEVYSRNKWVGKTTQEFVSVHGQPNETRKETDGGITYFWRRRYTRQQEVPLGGTTQQVPTGYQQTLYYETQTREFTCVLSITAKNGIITNYEQTRNRSGGCSEYNYK